METARSLDIFGMTPPWAKNTIGLIWTIKSTRGGLSTSNEAFMQASRVPFEIEKVD